MQGGITGLQENCRLTPGTFSTSPEARNWDDTDTIGIPLKPMLAKPTKAITEVLDRFEGKEFTCEYKYDGERAQVSCSTLGQVVISKLTI